MTVTRTDFVANTIDVEDTTMNPTQHLFALAIVYVTQVRAFNETLAVSC